MITFNNIDNKTNTEKFWNIQRKIYIIMFMILSFSFLRVPYIGSYLDAIFFEYIFGYLKFAVYGLLFLIIILLFFRLKLIKLLINRRFLLFLALSFLSVGIIFSSSAWEFSNISTTNFVEILSWYQKRYVEYFNTVDYKNFFAALTGGVISNFIYAIFKVCFIGIVYILSLIIMFTGACVLLNKSNYKFWKKIRIWMIKLLDYNNVYRSESDTLEMKDSDKKIKKNNKKLINEESTNTLNLIPPINLLNDTGVIRYNLCQEKMNTYKGILDGIFNEEGIKLDFFDIRVHPLYGEIVYKFFDETAINDVLKLKHDISLKIGEEQFALSVNENEFVIEFKNSPNESSKISIKNVLSNINIVPNSLMSFAGIFDNSTPFVYDLVTYNTTLIIGNKGSGSTMLLSVLLSSLLLLNSPEEIDIDVLTVKDDGIVNLFNKYDYINFVPFADVMNFLDKLYIEAENNLLSIKNKIVIINNYDVLIREYDDLFVLLEKLINFGKNNLKIILTASTVNSESTNDAIFNKIMGKFILKLEHETDSVIALGDNRGLQLCGNGDGYFVDGQQGTISRFQTCYLNQKELQSILEMCKIFYKKKIN